MDFLKNTFGIDLAMIEHRNWSIRIVTTVLWLFAISAVDPDGAEGMQQLLALYIFGYLFGMFIWGSVNFNRFFVNAPIPPPENSIHFDLLERANWLQDQTEKYSGTEHHMEELNYLRKKYQSDFKNFDTDRKKLTKQRKENYESNERVSNIRFKGPIQENIMCPHCQTKGNVHKRRRELTEESREKGVIGATIGRKTITKKGSVTELYCSSCDVTWQV